MLLAYQPLPIAGGSVPYGMPGYIDKAFTLADPQGMYPRPPGFHGGWDWFASPLEPVRSPRTGFVAEVKPSQGNSGQVFGGTVKVRDSSGLVWVHRHVDPMVRLGQTVNAGQTIARVTQWFGGPDHLHLEIWQSWAGGYYFTNAIDPGRVKFSLTYRGDKPPLPYDGALRLVVNGRQWSGWTEAAGAIQWIAHHGLSSDADCAISFRGPDADKPGVWRGARAVTNVCRNLTRTYLED